MRVATVTPITRPRLPDRRCRSPIGAACGARRPQGGACSSVAGVPVPLTVDTDPRRAQGAAARPPRRRAAPGHRHRAGRRDRLPRPAEHGRRASWAAGSSPPRTPARSCATWRRSGTPSAVMQTAGRAGPGGRRVRGGPGRRRRRLRGGAVRPRAARRARAWSSTPSSRRCWRASGSARRAPPSAGRRIRVGCLLTAMRHAARSREIAELAVRYRDLGVVGFDIAGAEAGFPPTRHLDAFEYLRQQNAHFTIHAGEAFGLPSIWEALQWCGADRLGHGVRIVDDITRRRRRHRPAGPARRLRAGQADPAGDVPDVQRAHRRGEVARRPPDRAARRSCASGSP